LFNFGKKQEDDPKKALDKARGAINTGLTGGLTKMFMGQDFVDKMNNGMDQGNAAIQGQQMGQMLTMTGLPATAEVLGIEDTGTLVNFNPVVRLQLKVTPSVGGVDFETTGQLAVSKIAIPRVGDKINIKYNPADPSQIVVM